ncbi:hypothetical protein C8J57DRAFT_1339898 [Mycena rebaudengoi]|nr:hypothetical protein C8J57DRAFT_1339898 [Mycena rebaudengoi]
MRMVSCSIRDMCVRVSRSMSQKAILRNPRSRMAKCLSCAVAASGTENSISSPSSRIIRRIERKETEDAARRMKWDGTPMKSVARWSSRRDGSETTVWIAPLSSYESLSQYTALLAENMRRSTFFTAPRMDSRAEWLNSISEEARVIVKSWMYDLRCGNWARAAAAAWNAG